VCGALDGIPSVGVLNFYFSPRSVQVSRHVVPATKPRFMLGPVVGSVSHERAVVVVEFDMYMKRAVMTLVDVVSGRRCPASRVDVKAGIPHQFIVTELQPDRRYHVVFEQTENTNERRGVVITPSHPSENKAVRIVSVNLDDCHAVTLDVDEDDAEVDDPWRWISKMIKDHERPFVIVTHMGGQIRLTKAMETARLYLSNGGDEEKAKDYLREAYRTQWNIPFKRDVLSQFCNMMIRGGGDIGLWGDGSMSRATNLGGGDIVRKLTMDIYMEYQYSLLDPLEAIPRPINNITSKTMCCAAAFTLYGSVAMLRLDTRSNRMDSSTGSVHCDRPMMSKEQWNFVCFVEV